MANPINPKTGKEYTIAELLAQVTELQAQVDAKNTKSVSFAISAEKGVISIAGFNAQFPISLYYSHLLQLNDLMPKIVDFAKRHENLLSQKSDTPEQQAAKKAARLASVAVDPVTKLPVVKQVSEAWKAKQKQATA